MELVEALGINAKLLIIQGVGFLVLLVVLKKFLFGRIMDAINARTQEVKETFDNAERDRQEAAKSTAQYEASLKDASTEADRKIQEAIQEAKSISDEIIRKSNESAVSIKAKAEEEIEYAKKQALAGVRDQVVDLTILSSSKLIEQSMNENTAKKLVDNVISEVGGLA